MTSNGCVRIENIFKMLDECAPGNIRIPADHYWHIKFNSKRYGNFPKGSHGAKNPEIQIGHIRKLIRHFEIEECAKRFLPVLN